jgi:hypothetical protein
MTTFANISSSKNFNYDTNLTYYGFHIYITIQFDTTLKKTITPYRVLGGCL